MQKKIIIRADGGSAIGMGHVVRCLALADMLKKEFEIVFAIQQPNESVLKIIQQTTTSVIQLPETTDYEMDVVSFSENLTGAEIVVLDGYNFKSEYQYAIREKGCKLVVIDDLHDWHHFADVIINHADGISQEMYSAESHTKYCLGLKYILLRKEFLNVPFRVKKLENISKFFISMGAADEHNNTLKYTKSLLAINSVSEIHLMLSNLNPHLPEIKELVSQNEKVKAHYNLSASEIVKLLETVDSVICPASSISLESCAVGVGLISGYTAENQTGNLNGLIKHKTLINFGDMNQLTEEDIKNKILKLIPYPSVFNELINNQRTMIDGKSPERLLSVFKTLN